MIDPIVEEIRRFRNEHAKKFNYDLNAICEDLKKHQLTYSHKLVRLKPKKMPNKSIQQTPALEW
jgi:hypothetical protein